MYFFADNTNLSTPELPFDVIVRGMCVCVCVRARARLRVLCFLKPRLVARGKKKAVDERDDEHCHANSRRYAVPSHGKCCPS